METKPKKFQKNETESWKGTGGKNGCTAMTHTENRPTPKPQDQLQGIRQGVKVTEDSLKLTNLGEEKKTEGRVPVNDSLNVKAYNFTKRIGVG